MKNMNFSLLRKSFFASLIIFLLVLFVLLSLCIGSEFYSPAKILNALFGAALQNGEREIILKIRLPRMLLALFLGGSLALSGFLLQTYFQNPIAGPFVLGISSGSKMCVAFLTIICLKNGVTFSSWGLILASLLGSLAVTAFVICLAGKIRDLAFLLVAGIMIGYVCSSITDLIVAFADDADIANLHGWTQGSFSGVTLENVFVCLPLVSICFFLSLVLSKPIGAYRLGEAYAKSLGVNVKIFRPVLILISSVLSAVVTAFAGPVSFVGVAVPFVVKRIFASDDPKLLIPLCFAGGAVFCLFADLISRMLFAPVELNVSVATSFFGAPVVIFMLLKRHGGQHGK